jgi:hypothetical protein
VTGTTSGPVAEGGCRCGSVRLWARGRPDAGVIYHHCRDYRKSSGAPVSLFAEYRMEQMETAQGMPKAYESSLGIRRSFCGDGGTPLSYEAERLPSEVYDMVASLDNPEPFEPETHARVSQKTEWLYQSGSIRVALYKGRTATVPGEQDTPVTLPGAVSKVAVGGPSSCGGFVR